MKRFLLIIPIIIFAKLIVAQERPHDCYFDEEQGYFISVKPAANGYVFTDNYCNSLYYLENGDLQTLVSAPGCGRYFNVSNDGKFVGYKHISDDGQAPAIINIENGKTEFLILPVNLCGQPTFFNDGVAFTVGDNLQVISQGNSEVHNLGYYSNIVSMSPDGTKVAFSNDDKIVLLNLSSGVHEQLSQENKMSSYPQFSSDGEKVLYQSEKMFVYEISTGKTFDLGYGLAPKWTFDSENIVFYNTTVDENTLTNAEIYICNYRNPVHVNLTNTDDEIEMMPITVSNSEIIYTTYSGREIYKLNTSTSEKELIYRHEGNLDIAFFNLKSTKSEVLISGEVPYTHQVYDTPDAHYGYGSCAAATSIMAIAYYNKLPKWPVDITTKLYPHTSDYGSYVSERYRFNEYYFENSSQPSGGGSLAYGGYGYMWGLGSPYSQMRNYIALHYFEAVQEFNSSVLFEDPVAEIDADYPFPMCVMLSSAGHLILAKGYIENQHTLIFSDPYGDKNTPSWPSYDGHKAYYDWPGYNNGYENLDYNGSYGVIAWTITAHAEEVTYNDTIIDNVFYHHGFEMNNSENGSQMRYFRDQNAGYHGHSWWTMTEATSDDICWVQWIPELTQEGYYRVAAYIPSTNASAENAPYRITHGGGTEIVLVDQADYNDEWAELGVYHFEIGDDFRVYLGDSTGIDSQPICYDAVWFEFIQAPVAAFETNDFSVCVDQPVSFTNLSTNANSFEWELTGADLLSSTEVNPEFIFYQPGVYNVKLKAIGQYESDSIVEEALITVYANPVASFSVSSNNVYLPDAYVCFINESSNASTYFWDFGNGQTSNDPNPFVLYLAEGSYFVTLSVDNEGCPENVFQLSEPVVVHGPLFVDNQISQSIRVYPNPAADVLFVQADSEILSVEIFNVLGKSVLQRIDFNGYLDINNLSEGIYTIIVKTTEAQYEYKIVVKR